MTSQTEKVLIRSEGKVAIVEFTGLTGAGKTTLLRAVKDTLADQGFLARDAYEIILERFGLDLIRHPKLRSLLIDIVAFLPFLHYVTTRKGFQLLVLAIRVIRRDARGVYEAFNLGRNFVKRIGVHVLLTGVLRESTDCDFVICDEGTLHIAHNLFVHTDRAPDLREIEHFSSIVPKPDIAIWVQASQEQSVEFILRKGHSRVGDTRSAVREFVQHGYLTFATLCADDSVRDRLIIIETAFDRATHHSSSIRVSAEEVAAFLRQCLTLREVSSSSRPVQFASANGVSIGRANEALRLHFVGVGPQRAGTSWLHHLLERHPSICFPRGVDEPMFFDLYYEKGFSRYIAYFAHRNSGELCGEVSPTYFDTEVVPARVRRVNPECRIIINVRNPISRALSLYRHHLSKGRVNGSFSDAVSQMPRILNSGRYARHIPRWLDTFGLDRVAFVLLDDVAASPEMVLKHIWSFLGVAEIAMPRVGKERVNPLTMPRFPIFARISAQTVTWLQSSDLYRVAELGKLLGLRKFVYEGGTIDLPGLTRSDQLRLLDEYETDIAYLESLLNRDLSTWRRIESEI